MIFKKFNTLILLCLMVAGCSRYQVATWPDTTPINSDFESTVQVEPGHIVKATLVSGKVVRGKVIDISDSQLSLEGQSEQGDSVRVVLQASEVAVLELEQRTSTSTILLTTVVVGGVVYAVAKGVDGWSLY